MVGNDIEDCIYIGSTPRYVSQAVKRCGCSTSPYHLFLIVYYYAAQKSEKKK